MVVAVVVVVVLVLDPGRDLGCKQSVGTVEHAAREEAREVLLGIMRRAHGD